jgi:hypothetical protein
LIAAMTLTSSLSPTYAACVHVLVIIDLTPSAFRAPLDRDGCGGREGDQQEHDDDGHCGGTLVASHDAPERGG